MRERTGRSMRPSRYTVEQVLRGMQAFVTEWCGPEVVLDPDKSVNEYREAAAESHECPLAFLSHMASHLNLKRDESRWVVWLKLRGEETWSKRQREEAWAAWQRDVAPTLTVRALAEYIARRAPGQSLAPATVFGVTCPKAGVFLGICDMPEMKGMRVAPSTPLKAIGSSTRIGKLFRRLEWVSGVSLPAIDGPNSTAVWNLAILSSPIVGLVSGVVAWDLANSAVSGAIALGAAIATLVLGWRIADRLHDPSPAGVVTFGDLARLVAARADAAAPNA
jgi:hypothetical protein